MWDQQNYQIVTVDAASLSLVAAIETAAQKKPTW